VTTVIGAIYPMRMFFTTALGELPRRRGFQPQRVRELGRRITAPMVVLAVLAAVGGFMGIPGIRASFAHYVYAGPVSGAEGSAAPGLAITAGLALLGANIAWALHRGTIKVPSLGRAGAAIAEGLHLDTAYDWVVQHTLLRGAPLVSRVDTVVGDVVLEEIAAGVETAAETGRRWQLGRVDAVTLSALAGVVVIAGAVVLGATGHLPGVGATR
jgi:NADH-quinone oxidoreductase subunit L